MCIFTTPASIIYFLINDMLSLFVRRLRRFRSAEFLEPQIITPRIEHGIEPEQRRGEVVRKVFALLFRRERGDDFLKARIAAQRIPNGTQTQFAVGWTEGDFREGFELANGQLTFASPRADLGKIS